MFNKIIDKNKIIEEMSTYNAVTLVNSRKEDIGVLLYDQVYSTEADKHSTIRFELDDSSSDYFLKINFSNILMYDMKKHELYIKAI